MHIPPKKTKDIILVTQHNRIIKVQQNIMRKRMDLNQQMAALSPDSACIVCNYAFGFGNTEFCSRVQAICHPFRKPKTIFPKKIRTHLLSESDFVDKSWVYSKRLKVQKRYDMTMFTLNSTQGANCKGFHILPMLDKVAGDLGLKVRVIDYTDPKKKKCEIRKDDYDLDSPKLAMWQIRDRLGDLKHVEYSNELLDERQLNKLIQRSRFSLFPNTKDASPRMIPESLIRGTPVIVNKNIWGGWKYVNDTTGGFFRFPQTFNSYLEREQELTDNFKYSIDKIMSRDYDQKDVKRNYYDDYGLYNTAVRLADVFNQIKGGRQMYRLAVYTDFAPYLEQISGIPHAVIRRRLGLWR